MFAPWSSTWHCLDTMKAIVDNWLLESTSALLNAEASTPNTRAGINWSDDVARSWSRRYETRIQGLFDFLEVYVLHDTIYYEESQSFTWKRFGSHEELDWLMPVNAGDFPQTSDIADVYRSNYLNSDRSDIVVDGALRYLALSQQLGASYWPVLDRREFLNEAVFSAVGESFLSVIRKPLEAFYNEFVEDLIALIPLVPRLGLPSFGLFALRSCNSRDSILSTAFQVRGTKEVSAFRKWLEDLETACSKANYLEVKQAIGVVEEVVFELKNSLKIGRDDRSFKFSLGLSPSVDLDVPKLWARRNRTERLVMTYLRGFLDSALSDGGSRDHITKVFPELESYYSGGR